MAQEETVKAPQPLLGRGGHAHQATVMEPNGRRSWAGLRRPTLHSRAIRGGLCKVGRVSWAICAASRQLDVEMQRTLHMTRCLDCTDPAWIPDVCNLGVHARRLSVGDRPDGPTATPPPVKIDQRDEHVGDHSPFSDADAVALQPVSVALATANSLRWLDTAPPLAGPTCRPRRTLRRHRSACAASPSGRADPVGRSPR